MIIRGTLAIGAVGLLLVVAEILQRSVIQALVILLPAWRDRLLAGWQRLIARSVLGLMRFPGGAVLGDRPRIPGDPGVLIVMNHQSLLDIPLVVASLRGGYPRIVTRARYARGKPLISHMMRLYEYPTVGSGATLRADLKGLEEAARTSTMPMVIFPEGTRTRTGDIGPFQRLGLRALLRARPWSVYLVVVDGLWECARLRDFVTSLSRVRGTMNVEGPFTSPERETEMDSFVDELRSRMQDMLRRSREKVAAA